MDKSIDLNEELIQAAFFNDLKQIKFLVEQGADIFYNDYNIFYLASNHNNLELLLFLIDQKCPKESIINHCLYSSVSSGSLDITKYLFKITDKNELNNLLVNASMHGHLEHIKFFAEQGADLSFVGILTAAINHDHLDIVQYLVLEKKCDLEAVIKLYSTASVTVSWCNQYLISNQLKNILEEGLSDHKDSFIKKKKI